MAGLTNLTERDTKDFEVPISAALISKARRRVITAYQAYKAEAERKARVAAQLASVVKQQGSAAKYVLNTPTPNPSTVGVVALKDDHAAAKYVLGTPTAPPRPQYPPYGASYSSNAVLAGLTVNQTTFIPVTVTNLSSQTWPAGGAFRLAYHWYRGGAEIIHDGARTFMPAAVARGASVTLNAKVVAPPSAGTSALRWDMVQENVAWFSDKGVAMSAPQSLIVTP